MSTPDGSSGGGGPKTPPQSDLSLESGPVPLIEVPRAGAAPVAQGPVEQAFDAWARDTHASHRAAATLASLRRCAQLLADPVSLQSGLACVRQEMPGGPEATASALLCLSSMAFDAAQIERFRVLLGGSFRLMQQAGLLSLPLAPAQTMGRLCASALRLGIEPQAVRGAILAQGIRPASEPDSLIWPWPVRLQTLGRLGLAVASQPLADQPPPGDMAHELLQRLVVDGGWPVRTDTLAQDLWPTAPGGPQGALDDTLQRLRDRLGHGPALQVHDGLVHLDPQHCWVDAWCFERLTEGLPADGQAGTGALDLDAANAALGLYSGHFLGHENDRPWALAYRERLRARFHGLVQHVGRHFESMNALGAAVSIYERGLEIDPTAEALYQQLMICHLNRGDHAKAMQVYRRCRESLAAAPAERTEQLHRAAMTPPRAQAPGRQAIGPAAP